MCIKVVGQIQKSCLRGKPGQGTKQLVVRLRVRLGDSISYLLLHNKLPQNLVAKGNNHFFLLINLHIGQDSVRSHLFHVMSAGIVPLVIVESTFKMAH